MCRLFGLHGGAQPVAATFWLLEAPDSLSVQSRRDPDGTGLGWYDDGRPRVERSPIAAYEDRRFAEQARHVTSRTYVAHVRFASTGGLRVENTHPFEQDGRLLAHNGVVGDLPQLDARLTKLGTRGLVRGDTDSERVFALVTGETRRTGGDLTAGLTAAVHWVAATLLSTRSISSSSRVTSCGRCATRTPMTCSSLPGPPADPLADGTSTRPAPRAASASGPVTSRPRPPSWWRASGWTKTRGGTR